MLSVDQLGLMCGKDILFTLISLVNLAKGLFLQHREEKSDFKVLMRLSSFAQVERSEDEMERMRISPLSLSRRCAC
jgi:hypothetical protein